VILYHHFAVHPCRFVDQLGIATPPDVFAAHLKWLSKRYDFVDLDAVLRGNLPKRPLLITFDDGYRSVLDIAAPMLKEHRAPGVFFLSERIIGDGAIPLDNLLSWLVNEHGLAKVESTVTRNPPRCTTLPEFFDQCIATMPYERRNALSAELASTLHLDLSALRRESGLYLRHDEVARLHDFGVEVGNHTRSHVHCRSLDSAAARVEIIEHKRFLEQLCGRPVRSFSFPYGSVADATITIDRALRESGHEAIFLVEARVNPRGHSGPYWHRVSMQAQPTSLLRRRIEVLPRLRSMRDGLRGRANVAARSWTMESGHAAA
jgi:peptidoglycan/xylan/chitin deacetylase (PgdA/CDA1 family)